MNKEEIKQEEFKQMVLKQIEVVDNEIKILQQELIDLYEHQIMDLVMMSKIELGDDVIAAIKRLKAIINDKIN
jgi:hypothetical protein